MYLCLLNFVDLYTTKSLNNTCDYNSKRPKSDKSREYQIKGGKNRH
ncbi:hypothetical protein D048_1763 [Vibrio parahaemolyticus VPTS-2009]|nr:hypothetical protein D048_1763 [Vibrio parahaemolyticus VPTS-2009]